MSCENLVIPKPLINQCPTNLFGIPYQSAGRTVAGTTYPISGIVIHCYDGTIAELCNEMKCRSRSSVISGSWENSFHYGIGAPAGSGGFQQFVNDNDISWTFGTYKNNTYATPPPPNIAINWPELQSEHGINTTPDVYTIDIALAIGHIVEATQQGGCYTCPTSSGLEKTQHDMLVQMLAYLVQEYNLPIDASHITFHDLIHCGEGVECPCTDISMLLAEVAAFCPPCEQEAPVAPVVEIDDNIEFIYGVTEACCPTSPGCYVQIPWNACFIGDLAVDGDLESYILGLAQDPVTGQWCLTRGCLATTAPIIGCGTVDDPLRLDLCLFGNWVPTVEPTDMINIMGTGDDGCLIQAPWCDMVVECETHITPIETPTVLLTVSGISDHTLQADVKVSAEDGNQIVILPDGLFVDFTCQDLIGETPAGIVETLIGVDGEGNCAMQDALALINRELCLIPEEIAAVPTWLLGKTADECPVYITPDAIIAEGLEVQDTTTVDLTLVGNLLTAEAIISPNAGNTLIDDGSGLYVPTTTILGSNCINVAQVGTTFTVTPIISPAILGTTNALQCAATGLFVPRGADANVNGPLTGNGSDANPLDIDFSALSGQDLCDFGSILPAGTLTNLIGLDNGDCLRYQNITDVVAGALSVTDTSCIDMSIVGGVISATPIISGAVSGVANQIQCLPTGLYVPTAAGLTVTDTTCVNLTLTNAGVLSAELTINPSGENALECSAGGLFVQLAAGLQVVDTDCINHTLVNGMLSTTPNIAGPQNGIPNVLSCITGQGFYVPESHINVIDTTCIDLTFTDGDLRADIILDPTGNNQVQCLPAGLYVPPAAGLTAVDTNCIAMNLANGELTATPILSAAQGGCANALVCDTNGLFVPTLEFPATNCIDVDVTGCVVEISPIISPDNCNGLECRTNGLYVNTEIDVVNAQSGQSGEAFNFALGGLPTTLTEYGNALVLNVANPSACNRMAWTRIVDATIVTFNNSCGTVVANVEVQGQWSNDGGTTWNNVENLNPLATVGPGETISLPVGSFSSTFTQAVGATNNFMVRFLLANSDGNFCGIVGLSTRIATATGIGITT